MFPSYQFGLSTIPYDEGRFMRQPILDRGAHHEDSDDQLPFPSIPADGVSGLHGGRADQRRSPGRHSAGGWGQPVWLTVGVAVLSFLGGALGFTAASNVKPDVRGHEAFHGPTRGGRRIG